MKASESHKLNDEEIKVEVARLRRELFDLRSQSVTQKVENPARLGHLRRDIARLLTEQRQRQLKKA